MTLPELEDTPFSCPDCGEELRVFDTAEDTANNRLWASCDCGNKQSELSEYPSFPVEWRWDDQRDRQSPNPITMAMYTMWVFGIGMGVLRLRIDYQIGELTILMAMAAFSIAVATAAWYKVFLPWDEMHTSD